MASARRIASLLTSAVAVSVGLVLAPAASAVVYCVPNDGIDPSCTAGQGQATVQGALTAAAGTTAVADTVRIGMGDFPVTNGDYNDATNAANTVQVIGAGTGATTLTLATTMGSIIGLRLNTLVGSSVSDLAITIPPNADANGDTGLIIQGQATGSDVLVTGPNASNAIGVNIAGTTTLDDSTVNLAFASPENFGVMPSSGSPTVTDSTLHANFGVSSPGGGNTVTIDRSTIQPSHSGAQVQAGNFVVRNSVIDLGTQAGAIGVRDDGINPISVYADGVTIVGGGAGSVGMEARATNGMFMDDAAFGVSNTVISGPSKAIRVFADNGRTATVTASYSNYGAPVDIDNDLNDDMTTGTATYTPSNITNLAPGFVNAAGGNYHLLSTSALLDIGDPTPAGLFDLDGDPRGLSMTGTCAGPVAGRRDIGADEFVPGIPAGCTPAPLTPAQPGATTPTKKKCKKKRRRGSQGAVAAKKCKRKGTR